MTFVSRKIDLTNESVNVILSKTFNLRVIFKEEFCQEYRHRRLNVIYERSIDEDSSQSVFGQYPD